MSKSTKYTKDKLTGVVKESFSYAEVMRSFGTKWSGGQQECLKRWIKEYEIDTSHFTGQAHQKGRPARNKKHWSEWLFLNESQCFRTKAIHLRKAMIESGVEYVCRACGQEPQWLGKPMTLQVEHKNSNWKDNRKENLEFLCPNCHSVTEGWSGKKSPCGEMADTHR
jgi:hypothetical protein